MYIKRQFGSEAVKFIRSQLYWNDPITESLRELPLEHGEVFAYLPAAFNLEREDDFDRGYPYDPEDPSGGDRQVLEYMSSCLSNNSSSVLLFHSFLHENDPPVSRITVPFVLIGEPDSNRGRQICHIVYSKQAGDLETLSQALLESRPWPAITQVTDVNAVGQINIGSVLTHEMCRSLALATSSLIVGAFADEAKLIWRRT